MSTVEQAKELLKIERQLIKVAAILDALQKRKSEILAALAKET